MSLHGILGPCTLFFCHTPSFTYHFVTHKSSHITCFTSRSSTTSFVCPSFPVPATTFVAHYWKKLTCGVIRSLNCFSAWGTFRCYLPHFWNENLFFAEFWSCNLSFALLTDFSTDVSMVFIGFSIVSIIFP